MRFLVLFWRAARLRCPNCGGHPLFSSWVRMRERCPVCGIRLERGEEGYQVGAYMFNIVAAELIFAAIFLGVLVYTWPAQPWDELLYGGVAFLTFDLIFRPPAPEDFEVSWMFLRESGSGR